MHKPEMNHDKPMAPKCIPEDDIGHAIPRGGLGGGLYLKDNPPKRKAGRMNPPKFGNKRGSGPAKGGSDGY